MLLATAMAVRTAIENAGVVLIDEEEEVTGPGARLKWGVKIQRRVDGEGAAAGEDGAGGVTAAWEDIEEAADLEALLSEPEALNPDMAEMWRDDPDLWARLSQGGRETLSRRMYGDTRAVDEEYFRHGA
jgi:hypothetical protein